jgi:transcriptional regulator with XRE-family HTH domain|nr:MAG: DUF4115 domain-containing protein [Actinomycetota bacterium]
MSGNTDGVTESVGGSGNGGGGAAGVARPEVRAEMKDIRAADGRRPGATTGDTAHRPAREITRLGSAGTPVAGGRGGATAVRDREARPGGIGAKLARAREEAGMSVAELSLLTRIREPVIRAIEHDDFSMGGGDFYTRGHIRNIARAIGLDPGPILQEYDEQCGGAPQPVRAAEVFLAEIPIKLRERRSVNWTTALAFLLILVVAFGIARLLSGGTTGGVDSADLRRSPAQPAATASRAAAPSAAPSRQPAAAVPAPVEHVAVQVTADRTTRLLVRDADGKRLFRGDLTAGSTSEWRAKGRITLTVDDAGAVRLRVNGKNLGPAGREGERVTRSFRPPRTR